MNEAALTSYLQKVIPVSQSIGFEIRKADLESIELWAPLSANHNHMGTAFGGSLSNVLILACYTWLFNLLHDHALEGHVLIKEANIKYLLPVDRDFRAICSKPGDEATQKFLTTFKRKNLGQIFLTATITLDSEIACLFEGIFVATKN